MDETTTRISPKRFVCDANLVLVRAMKEFMTKNGFTSERKATEFLLRETLTNRGHLPAPKL